MVKGTWSMAIHSSVKSLHSQLLQTILLLESTKVNTFFQILDFCGKILAVMEEKKDGKMKFILMVLKLVSPNFSIP
jgi:hypothetical protein